MPKVTQPGLGLAEQQPAVWLPGAPSWLLHGLRGRQRWAGRWPQPRATRAHTLPTAGERREGVNASVSSDVQSVFKGKTYGQLQVIFQGIEGKIRAGGPNLDMGYWESLLQQLRAHMARAR